MEVNAVSVALGAIVGLILALTGAGGGILAVPLLVFGQHLPIMQAAPIALIAVGAASALGAALGLRDGLVRYRAAALIGITGMLLAPVGVWLARWIPNSPLTIAFSFVLAWVAWRMFNQARRTSKAALTGEAPKPCVLSPDDGRLIWTLPCARALAGTGAFSGVLSGLLGVGGGFVIVPALNRYTHLEMRSIVATSLAVIALISVGAVGGAALQGAVTWSIALPFTAGAVVAHFAGRLIAARIASTRLQKAFAIVAGAVAVLLLARGVGWIAG